MTTNHFRGNYYSFQRNMKRLLLLIWLGLCYCLFDVAVAVNPAENEVDNYAHKNHQEHPKSPASELIRKSIEKLQKQLIQFSRKQHNSYS